jgi:hypothetical protein
MAFHPYAYPFTAKDVETFYLKSTGMRYHSTAKYPTRTMYAASQAGREPSRNLNSWPWASWDDHGNEGSIGP